MFSYGDIIFLLICSIGKIDC